MQITKIRTFGEEEFGDRRQKMMNLGAYGVFKQFFSFFIIKSAINAHIIA